MKIVLAFDSFKGAVSAAQAVEAAARGVLDAMPEATVVRRPMADGGEGTSEILCDLFNADTVSCASHDALMRPLTVSYGYDAVSRTAILESAAAAGITLLTGAERTPMTSSSFGVGEMLADAVDRGAQRIIIGIGGIVTADCGMGMFAALGVRFTDADGRFLAPCGANLQHIAAIDRSGMLDLGGVAIDVVNDVDNPLYGPNGSPRVYGPQKGATPANVEALEAGFRHFASLCTVDPATPGAGAAGGLGYAFLLLGGKLRRGSQFMLDTARFDDLLAGADLVITGEGKIDRQTLCGKLPLAVMQRARARGVPCIALAGAVEHADELRRAGFADVLCINPDPTAPDCMQPAVAIRNIRNTIQTLINQLKQS